MLAEIEEDEFPWFLCCLWQLDLASLVFVGHSAPAIWEESRQLIPRILAETAGCQPTSEGQEDLAAYRGCSDEPVIR